MAAGAVAVVDDPEVVDIQKTSSGTSLKRLNINVTEDVYNEVQALAKEKHQSVTELVRLGLGLVNIAHVARKDKLKLAIVNAAGTPVREIVVP